MDLPTDVRYLTSFIRNSKAVGVMWGVLTICFAIINIVAFIMPQWIGDTPSSSGIGYMGLFEVCEFSQQSGELSCTGRFNNFDTIVSGAFKGSTFFIGFSCLMILISIVLFVLFFFIPRRFAYLVGGILQLISGVCMFLGCIIYPVGWDVDAVKRICGPDTNSFQIGNCGVRYAFILAIIGIFDAFFLASVALVLCTKEFQLHSYKQDGEHHRLNGKSEADDSFYARHHPNGFLSDDKISQHSSTIRSRRSNIQPNFSL